MNERTVFQYASSAAAAALSFVAVCSWRGLVEDPIRFTGPALFAAFLVALTGATARTLRWRWYGVLPLQLVVLLIWFHHRQHVDTLAGGWLPTPHGISGLFQQLRIGASAIDYYAAPVSADHVNAPIYLTAAALLVLVSVDLIACGLRQPTWAGLPVLIAVTIPISILEGGLPGPAYVGTAVLYVVLLAIVEADRALSWARPAVGRTGLNRDDPTLQVSSISAPALAIGGVTTVIALVLSIGVPVGNGLFGHHNQSGSGPGPGGTVTLVNPLVTLRRDLIRRDHLPLLDVTTDAVDPSYLRLTVLDVFTGSAWMPSPRDLGSQYVAQGALPDPLGQYSLQAGTDSTWTLRTTDQFVTTWLPTPFPTRAISIDKGNWRYDPHQLDIASVDKVPPTAVSYALTAFAPAYTSADLDRTEAPPSSVTDLMTKVPDLPPTVSRVARQVTASGQSEYAKAVLLQDWFRRTGGFTYSLAPAAGDGLGQLERFITTDKVGYCEQFAAAMAVMARSLGIPARVVVGFLSPHQLSPGSYEYTSDDLHAWPEIYFRGYGWVRFEPTPSARTGAAPRWTRESVNRPNPILPTPSASLPQVTRPRSTTPAPRANSAGGHASGSAPILPISIVAVLVLLGLCAPTTIRRRQRARRLGHHSDARTDIEALWAELGSTAVDLRLHWPADRSARMIGEYWSGRVLRSPDGPVGTGDREGLDRLVALVERARYQSEFAVTATERDDALEIVVRWSLLMAGAVGLREARIAVLLPRSVLMSPRQTPQTADPDLVDVRG